MSTEDFTPYSMERAWSFMVESYPQFRVFSTICLPSKLLGVFDDYKDEIVLEMNDQIDRTKTFEKIKHCEALICCPYYKVDKGFLDQAPKLKFISTLSASYENIDIEECFKRNIRVTTSPYFDSGALAEYTIGLMIDLSRNITLIANKVRGIDWKPLRKDLYWYSGMGLKDSVIGIVGLGNIGMGVA